MSRSVKIMGTITRTPIEDLGDPVQKLFGTTPGVYYNTAVGASLLTGLDGTGAVAGDLDPLGTVLDLSGQGRHATAATSGARAQLVELSGGVRAIQYDGVSSLLRYRGNLPLRGPLTIITAVARGDATDGGAEFGSLFAQTDGATNNAVVRAESFSRVRLRAQLDIFSRSVTATTLAATTFSVGSSPHLFTAEFALVGSDNRLRGEGSSALDRSVASNWEAADVITDTDLFPGLSSATGSANFRLFAYFAIARELTAGEIATVQAAFRTAAGMP